jgi:hypothetical protein
MKNKFALTTSLALLCFIAFAQQEKGRNYFIIKGKDTTHCQELKYKTTAQGYLSGLEYTDDEGKKVKIDGRKKVPDVETICVNNVIYDKVPLKASKPDSYIRYTERVVDGKVKVYLDLPEYNYNYASESGGPVGKYRFFVKLPDGTYYKINSRSNMKKYIEPYLKKCDEFRDGYKGPFSSNEEEFKKMIKYYNSVCK